jgi:AICAR transformylase/IMP cyclohydrolase PurH
MELSVRLKAGAASIWRHHREAEEVNIKDRHPAAGSIKDHHPVRAAQAVIRHRQPGMAAVSSTGVEAVVMTTTSSTISRA